MKKKDQQECDDLRPISDFLPDQAMNTCFVVQVVCRLCVLLRPQGISISQRCPNTLEAGGLGRNRIRVEAQIQYSTKQRTAHKAAQDTESTYNGRMLAGVKGVRG